MSSGPFLSEWIIIGVWLISFHPFVVVSKPVPGEASLIAVHDRTSRSSRVCIEKEVTSHIFRVHFSFFCPDEPRAPSHPLVGMER